MNAFTVVLDACVLYPAHLRSLFMYMARLDLFRAKWTADIHDEWTRNLLEARPDLSREKLNRTRALMDANVRDALVTGYESLIPTLELPDPDDRHVLAAAIRCRADAIVTNNIRDFPAEALKPFDLEAVQPDVFFCQQFVLDQAKVLSAVKTQRESMKNPPMLSLEFLDLLERQQLPLFVSELRRFADVM